MTLKKTIVLFLVAICISALISFQTTSTSRGREAAKKNGNALQSPGPNASDDIDSYNYRQPKDSVPDEPHWQYTRDDLNNTHATAVGAEFWNPW